MMGGRSGWVCQRDNSDLFCSESARAYEFRRRHYEKIGRVDRAVDMLNQRERLEAFYHAYLAPLPCPGCGYPAEAS